LEPRGLLLEARPRGLSGAVLSPSWTGVGGNSGSLLLSRDLDLPVLVAPDLGTKVGTMAGSAGSSKLPNSNLVVVRRAGDVCKG
jgi:hypothetical protein